MVVFRGVDALKCVETI